MQTTLLGLAIAFIVALVAALVGPYFVDWNQFRSQFEAEATRIAGAPVRVSGALDARILPTPTLRLREVAVGNPNEAGKVRADKLDVEFSLGSLLRGEWRATELAITGAAVDVGLDPQGQIDWPLSGSASNLGSLAIDRLTLTGRIAFHDASSGGSVELEDVAFGGDVRSLAGALRGDGNFRLSGNRYPFRISSSPQPEGGARVRLVVDRAQTPWSADIDGVLGWDARSPRFDGAMTMTGAVAQAGSAADGAPAIPWRMSAKVKADLSMARLDQIEATYGGEDTALKLSGQGDALFGAAPSLRATLAARQIDADKFLAKNSADAEPLPIAPKLRSLAGVLPTMPIVSQLELRAEQVTFGGRAIQSVALDLRGGLPSWTVDRFEARAPGETAVVLKGRTLKDPSRAIDGALSIESGDPGVFVSWLQGRGDGPSRTAKPFRFDGQVQISSDRIAVNALRAEIDGGKLEGNLVFATLPDGGARLETALKADRLDLEAATSLLKSLGGAQSDWPSQAQVALDFGTAVSAGQELRPFVVKLSYGPKLASLDDLRIGGAAGIALTAKGTLDRETLTSALAMNLRSDSFKQIGTVLAPYAPAMAARFDAMSGGPVQMKLAFNLDKDGGRPDRGEAKATATLDAPQFKATATATAAPTLAALKGLDADALWRSAFTINAAASAQSGRSLIALLGLDRAVAIGDTPLRIEGTVGGASNAPLQVKAIAGGAELDADVAGTVEPWGEKPKATASLVIRNANLAPLLGGVASDAAMKNMALKTRVSLDGDRVELRDLDSTVAGSRVRGRVAFGLGDDKAIDGEVGMDRLDLAPAFGYAIGVHGRSAEEPLRTNIVSGWTGRVTFQALRGILPGGLELQQVGGIIRGDGRALTFDAIKGTLGGGTTQADIDVRQSADGLAVNGRFGLSGVDGSALRYRGLSMPQGKTSLQMTLAGQGRSESALVGGLFGNGVVTLENARIVGLDAGVFDIATRASDSGQVRDDARLRQIVEPILAKGAVTIASAQIPFTIKDSRLRVGATTLDGEGARLIVSGGYDIPADQADIRASMTPANAGAGASRPEIQIFAAGPPDALNRTTDVAALSSWLAVRAIDRETRRLDAIERGVAPPASAPSAAATPSGPSAEPGANGALPELPTAEVPIPGRDPRRAPPPKPAAPRAAAPAPPSSSAQQVSPLPPPVEVHPAPVVRPRPRGPLDLLPNLFGR